MALIVPRGLQLCVSLVISHCVKLYLPISFKSVTANILLRRWKQTIISRCQIRAVCGMIQGPLVAKLPATQTYFLTDRIIIIIITIA